MANENVINTRIRLKSDTYANWGEHQDTFKPLPGEVCIVEVQTVNSDSQVAPTILFKVGSKKDPAGGAEESNLYTFAELPWASALAADVYPWAKERNFPMQRDPSETGEPGNAISSMKFENGKLVYTTTNVVTQEEFAAAMEANAEATAELAVTVLSEAQKNIAIALQEYKPSWNSLTDKPFEEKVFDCVIL